MPTIRESVCCKEIEQTSAKLNDLDVDTRVDCITLHPGFGGVCLDPWVLETACYAVQQTYGRNHIASQAGYSQNESVKHLPTIEQSHLMFLCSLADNIVMLPIGSLPCGAGGILVST